MKEDGKVGDEYTKMGRERRRERGKVEGRGRIKRERKKEGRKEVKR